MRWFSHRRRTGGGPRPRGQRPNKMPHFFVFVLVDLDLWSLTLSCEFERDFCTMHLTAKFHHPMFNRSEVIMLTNRQTDKQTPLKTSISLRYATTVDNISLVQLSIHLLNRQLDQPSSHMYRLKRQWHNVSEMTTPWWYNAICIPARFGAKMGFIGLLC